MKDKTERKTQRGRSKRHHPTESGTKPWRSTEEKENPKATLVRRKKKYESTREKVRDRNKDDNQATADYCLTTHTRSERTK